MFNVILNKCNNLVNINKYIFGLGVINLINKANNNLVDYFLSNNI